MKYVWIVVAVIILVRIDVILRMVDKVTGRFQSAPAQILPGDVNTDREVLSIDEDKVIQTRPKTVFLSLLKNFRINPQKALRERALSELKKNPSMFDKKLDTDFESVIYNWRDLLQQRNREAYIFLLELLAQLEGENREAVRKVFSLSMSTDMGDFVTYYSRAKDPNCLGVTVIGDRIVDEEKLNEFLVRKEKLDAFLAREKIEPDIRAFANTCLTALKVYIHKISPESAIFESGPQNNLNPEESQP